MKFAQINDRRVCPAYEGIIKNVLIPLDPLHKPVLELCLNNRGSLIFLGTGSVEPYLCPWVRCLALAECWKKEKQYTCKWKHRKKNGTPPTL